MSPLQQFGLMVGALYVAAWASRKAGVSTIVGFLGVGVLLGPGGPWPVFVADDVVALLAELGLLLLLFFMGLEFSFPRFLEGGRRTLRAGVIDLLGLVVGVGLGLALGFGGWGSLFLGAAVYISSSGVIAKLLSEGDLVAYPETERTLGVLVFEDLAMVVVLAGLGIATSGGGGLALLGVLVFLALYGALLRWGRPGLERLLSREDETLVLLLLALVLLFAVAAGELGFPGAVAAFLLGMIVAESRHRERVRGTLEPWHAVAAAAFFFDVGLHVEAGEVLARLPDVAVLLVVVSLVQVGTGTWAGRVTGLSLRGSVGHGLMLIPRGEFTLVVAGLAAGAPQIPAATGEALRSVASLYVVASVLLGSVVLGAYDTLTERAARPFRPARARPRDAEREAELDAVRLD